MFFHFPDTYRMPQLPGIPSASVGEFRHCLALLEQRRDKRQVSKHNDNKTVGIPKTNGVERWKDSGIPWFCGEE